MWGIPSKRSRESTQLLLKSPLEGILPLRLLAVLSSTTTFWAQIPTTNPRSPPGRKARPSQSLQIFKLSKNSTPLRTLWPRFKPLSSNKWCRWSGKSSKNPWRHRCTRTSTQTTPTYSAASNSSPPSMSPRDRRELKTRWESNSTWQGRRVKDSVWSRWETWLQIFICRRFAMMTSAWNS